MQGRVLSWVKENLLGFLTVIGVIVGVVAGIVLQETTSGTWTSRNVMYMQFIGDLYLQMLRGLVLPLIVSSLVAAVSSMDISTSGRIGGLGMCYYLATTVLAVIFGVILAIVVKPGVNRSVDSEIDTFVKRNVTTVDTLLDLVRNLFPPNYVQATLQQYQTELIPPHESNLDAMDNINLWKVDGSFVDGSNILGLVVGSIIFGIALSLKKKAAPTLYKLFQELNQIIMTITLWVIWLTPIGVLFIICAKFVESDNMDVFIRLGIYFLTVVCGMLFYGFAILPLIYFLLTRKNPYILVRDMGQAIATAFGTASSSATIPVTLQCLENNHGLDSRVTRFMIPIGAMINMNGTAVYEAAAVIFIAQLRDMPLTFVDYLAISLTATAASIGAAAIPQAALVAMVVVLEVVGLPPEDISIVLAVDWLLGRFRTVANIMGDSYGAGIIEHHCKKLLEKLNDRQQSDTTIEDSV
ncbi:excitatory amino acid transporter 3-like [Lutzomyia longipalpis]|uniref:excitatory amino acid transporter 3-like n=1 Tax=Lutzomyia longipalpis TaxID=7200 RepID=UPI00248374B7|nr:excitatory amino acid transporter 3-like [Lutzomyia longipalpis]